MSRLLQTVCDAASLAFNLYFSVYLLDGTDQLNLVAAQGPYGDDFEANCGELPPAASDRSLPVQAIKQNRVIRAANLHGQTWQQGRTITPIGSELAMPLMVGDHTLGILDVQRPDPNAFDDLDTQILNLLAHQVAIAIENARLYEEKVQDAQKMRHLSDVKTTFLSTLSHELRTPLNVLMGYIDMMLLKLEPPEPLILDGLEGSMTLETNEPAGVEMDVLKNNLLRMKDSTIRLNNQINGLLDIARIEAGRLDVQSEPFSLREVVEAIEGQAIALNKNHLHFSCFVDDHLPEIVSGDREKIERIILNLLSNAFKFTQRGEVELMLEPNTRGNLIISVRDTGPGITPDQRALILEEFQQVERGEAKQYGSTRLGLTITQNLIKTLGGSIQIESAPGQGSTFIVTLPIRIAGGQSL